MVAFKTPITCITVNKLDITQPASGSTLTIADGATLTVNGSATITNGTHSGTNTGDQTTISGNAGSATVLQTARTINGVSFNGSANITISASVTVTEIEVDFGSVPITSATFNVTDAIVSTSSNIMISLTGKTATGRVGNDYTWDSISYSAVPGTGNFVLDAVINNGSVVGKRKLIYLVTS